MYASRRSLQVQPDYSYGNAVLDTSRSVTYPEVTNSGYNNAYYVSSSQSAVYAPSTTNNSPILTITNSANPHCYISPVYQKSWEGNKISRIEPVTTYGSEGSLAKKRSIVGFPHSPLADVNRVGLDSTLERADKSLTGCDVAEIALQMEVRRGIGTAALNESVQLLKPPLRSLDEGPYTPRRRSPAIFQTSQNTSPPPSVRASADNPPLQRHDGGASRLNRSQPGSPYISAGPDIELSGLSSREVEEPPPPGQGFENTRTQGLGEERHRSMFSLLLCSIAIFLAPVNIVSGMTASHGDSWKLAFVGFFISWLLVGTTWLILDLRRFERSLFTKRCLWHLGGCAASLYFFMSILHIKSDNLPQWLPTAIDCGVGTSLGFQSIPASARHRVGESIGSVIGSIFGGTQVIIRRDEQQLLQREEPSSPRRHRTDIETDSMV